MPRRRRLPSAQVLNGIRGAVSRGQSPLAALQSFAAAKLSNNSKARASASDLLWSFVGMFLAVTALGVMNLHVRSWPVVGEWHQQVGRWGRGLTDSNHTGHMKSTSRRDDIGVGVRGRSRASRFLGRFSGLRAVYGIFINLGQQPVGHCPLRCHEDPMDARAFACSVGECPVRESWLR